ncbi:hypothetical protein [Stutzerimonas nitrititolerans]|uniref:hypothetical protein n=1 Tax=Stutzerimonas nitrititolerans TaxID=2482751 RepID=UPI0028AB2938|nr:hypothetical protein [Stutzerimonas nitrititolerans]
MAIHKPSWFSKDHVMVSTAPTCGLTKGGRTLPLINQKTGARVQVLDPETGELVDGINDCLLEDMEALRNSRTTSTLRFIESVSVSMRAAVPVYYDRRLEEHFEAEMRAERFRGFRAARIGDLIKEGLIEVRGGHGSPKTEQRVGEVPYIKVSDLRAGLLNVNPTNRVPLKIAENHWRGTASGLRPFDLLCPERTSKNIGDFCVLMPGQERVLLTKEVIVIRPGPKANFDSFFLLWALTLNVVRDQWKRVVFMQTNREDVGKRYLEILIPITESAELAERVGAPFRNYYTSLAEARSHFAEYLRSSGQHHFFVSGAEEPDPEVIALSELSDDELEEVD